MISILIPLYNVEKYIARCLDSILSQTFQDFEIIVVNDFTLDNSAEIVKSYMLHDKRIRIINNEENMGLAWARFVGYSSAIGDYYVFCDSDDFLPNDALEILYNSIKGSDADIICGNFQVTYSDGTLGKKSNNKSSYGSDAKSIYKSLLKDELSHSLWGKIYKKEIFNNKNYITNKGVVNAEDAFLFYQIIKNVNKLIVIPEVVYCYYQNSASATKVRLSNHALKNIVSYWNLRDLLLKNDVEIYPLLQEKLINSYCILLQNGYNKNFINSLIKIEGFDELTKLQSLYRRYGLNKSIIFCIKVYLFSNKLVRKLFKK